MKDCRPSLSFTFEIHRHVYLHSPLWAGCGRCYCCVSVRAGSVRRGSRVWATWWLPGCQAGWEAYESEGTSDTVGGTSCRRWFSYLRANSGEGNQSWLFENRLPIFRHAKHMTNSTAKFKAINICSSCWHSTFTFMEKLILRPDLLFRQLYHSR